MTRHVRDQTQVGAAAPRPAAEFVPKIIQHDPRTVSGRNLNLPGHYAALRLRHEYRLVIVRSLYRGVLRTGQKLNSP